MSACEKCWADALKVSALTGEMQIEAYTRITNNRNKLVQCTPKEQAGQWWDEEKQRDSRKKVGK